MSSNIYTTGLRNDGSYKVSGQPFIVRKVINVGQEVKVEFPYVTKNVTIRIPTPPNNAIQTTAAQGRFMTSQTDPPGPGVYDLGGSGKDFTVSFWYKQTETWSINKNPFTLTLGNTLPKKFRMKAGANKHQYAEIDPSTGYPAPNGDFTWFRITITQITGSSFLYFDDQLKASKASNHSNWDDFQFPANSNPIGGGIDEVMVFTVGMDNSQVEELHNSGEYFNPNHHSLSASLQTWHTGDAPGDGVNTGQEIKDLAGINEPAPLFPNGNNSFLAGPWTTQTTGKVRVHTLSTGSASGANIVANNHYKELQGYGESYTFSMKGKEIYISGLGAQTTVEVIAELTNIPTGSMYALTGSGIDE